MGRSRETLRRLGRLWEGHRDCHKVSNIARELATLSLGQGHCQCGRDVMMGRGTLSGGGGRHSDCDLLLAE